MRVLLVSTYELGHQPVHLALPAAALRARGIDVLTLDLALEEIGVDLLDQVDAVAFSVPMHTAMRLATNLALEVRATRPEMPIAFYGLYAGVGRTRSLGEIRASVLIGEYVEQLVEWALRTSADVAPMDVVSIGHPYPRTPDRTGLPRHEGYARLEWEGTARVAAAVEGSRGCRHRCRHCPIPVVYDGRLRVTGAEAVLEDIDQLVAEGVEHVTFADPDFFNAPRYSLDLLRSAHAAHPGLTFDVTVKVEHILAHRRAWPEMARLGVLFVTSAFESVDQRTLDILDKNHSVDDMAAAIETVAGAGSHLRPTWLPFFPWTRPSDVLDLIRFLDRHRLWPATDPVQLSIRLLVPEGSLLEAHPALLPHLRGYDPTALTWAWDFEDPVVEDMQATLERIAADGSDCGAEAEETLDRMRRAVGDRLGVDLGPLPGEWAPMPRLTESWFCCAEPTSAQATAVTIGVGRVAAQSTTGPGL